jgi:hypothetical protein
MHRIPRSAELEPTGSTKMDVGFHIFRSCILVKLRTESRDFPPQIFSPNA